jgi:hypothetical protein
MNRLMIFAKNEQVIVQPERLQTNPPGNGAQRRKALKSGWQPSWVKTGQPSILDDEFETDFITLRTGDEGEVPGVAAIGIENFTQESCDIYNENEHAAMLGRDYAKQTVENILDQIGNFETMEFTPVPVFIGHQLLCWVCDEKFAVTTHEHHPICDDCLDHFLGRKESGKPIGVGHEYYSGSHNPDTCSECILERATFHKKVADAQEHS